MFTLPLSGTKKAPLQSNTEHRRLLLICAKQQIMVQFCDPNLDANVIASRIGISKRYLNNLFHDKETSLMRFVLNQRMAECRKQLLNTLQQERQYPKLHFRQASTISRISTGCLKVTSGIHHENIDNSISINKRR